MEPICFTWNLGIFRNLYLEPLLGTSEPSGTLYDWNPYLEPRNLPEPLLGTLILGTSEPSEPLLGTPTWNLGTCRNLYLEPLYLEPRNLRNLTWNPYLEPRNLPEPLLGTLTRNLGTCRNLYLEPLLGTSEPAGTFTWNPYLEPRSPPEPLLGTLTWNLGTCRNLYLEPLLGTSEPARTWRDDCPRVPQGLVWLGPQSFQLLGKKTQGKRQLLHRLILSILLNLTNLISHFLSPRSNSLHSQKPSSPALHQLPPAHNLGQERDEAFLHFGLGEEALGRAAEMSRQQPQPETQRRKAGSVPWDQAKRKLWGLKTNMFTN